MILNLVDRWRWVQVINHCLSLKRTELNTLRGVFVLGDLPLL